MFLQKRHLVDNVTIIPVASLITVCIYNNIDNELYIALPVNDKEIELIILLIFRGLFIHEYIMDFLILPYSF